MPELSCRSCGHDNRADSRFCLSCGAAFSSACPSCGRELPAAAGFCDGCGQHLGERVASPSASSSSAPSIASQRGPASGAAYAGGRYQVTSFLGEGGKKRVHLASDTRLNRDVAIAVVKTEGLDEAARIRLRREAEAMGQLGDHPGIVTVYDVAEDEGQLYIVSQYMAGGDLEARLSQAEGRRLEVAEALALADQIAAALEYAHGRGVIHRDLKPGNIWLASDGSAALGDFGLALTLGHSRITQEGMMVGTAAYMPPEQALGREPDTRSDLYALGATLYEMLVGRPPFVGDDTVAVISQHINTPPVGPSWHNAKVSKPLEALVLDLLAKDPEARPANARHVRERLAALSQMADPSLSSDVQPTANPLDGLASGVFVGREEEVGNLRRGVDEALSGRARIFTLMGEPGIGKTRLCEELTTYASMRGAQVLWGRCYEGEGAPPYWPWVQMIRSHAHECDPQILMSEMGPAATHIAEVVSEVRARLPGLPEATPLDPEQARFRLFDGIASFLRNASAHRPLVLVFDDLHWADKPSLMLLQFLARELGDDRLFVLATYRDVELGRQHPLSETLAELARNNRIERVPLGGLGEADVARFIEDSAGIEPPAGLIAAVFRETEGNPFFVTEVVRLLASDRRLEKANEVASWSLEVPQGVREVVGRRLNGLSEDCNETLAIASVIGRDFEAAVLRRCAACSEDRVLELIEEALSARLLQAIPGSLGRYRFSHALVRETLYEELSTPRRVRLHARVSEVLEEHYAGRSGSHLAEISHHAFQAIQTGDAAHAVAAARRAGDFACDQLAHEEAALHYERAAQALEAADTPDPDELCELVVRRAELQQMAGESAAARETALHGAELARQLGSADYLGRAALAYGGFMFIEMGRSDQTMVALGQEALAALGDSDSALRVKLLRRLESELGWSDHQDAVRLHEEAVRVARRLGDPGALIDAFINCPTFWNSRERIAEAHRETDEVEQLASNTEQLRSALVTRRFYLLCEGRRDEFDRVTARLIDVCEEVGGAWAKYARHLMGATGYLIEGRFEEAKPMVASALQEGLRSLEQSAVQSAAGQLMGIYHHNKGLRPDPAFRAAAERFSQYPMYSSIVTFAYADTDDREACREIFERIAARNFEDVQQDANWTNFMYFAGYACVFLEDTTRAETLYRLLLPFAGIHAHTGAAFGYVGSLSFCLAKLATLLGNFADAEQHFEETSKGLESMRAWPWLAENEYDFARMLLIRGGGGDRQRALELLNRALERAQEIGMTRLLERGLVLKLEAQGVDSGSLSQLQSIDVVAHSLSTRKPDLTPHAAPDGTVTLMFSDMQGFSSMIERLGDLKGRDVIRDHNRIVRENLAIHGGYEVELMGDGFLLAFQSARQALLCAIAIQRAFARYSEANAEEPIRVRIGIHTGEALRDADKFFGKTVILAARIASQADGGQILVSALVKQLTESVGDVVFGNAREVPLKGISDLQQVVEVSWS